MIGQHFINVNLWLVYVWLFGWFWFNYFVNQFLALSCPLVLKHHCPSKNYRYVKAHHFTISSGNPPQEHDIEIVKADGTAADTAIILASPDGTRFRVTVSNIGVLTATGL